MPGQQRVRGSLRARVRDRVRARARARVSRPVESKRLS